MMWLLQMIIFGHVHKWKTTGQTNLLNSKDDVIGIVVFLECETCGLHKRQDLN